MAREEIDEARAALLDARFEATQLGFSMILWRIDVKLADIAAANGDESQAAELRDEARRLIEKIADGIDGDELQSSFLGLPDVQAVTSGPAR